MKKMYFLIEPTGYNKYISAAASGSGYAKVFPGYSHSIEERLFKLHNSWPLNKTHELPFKCIWNKLYTNDIPLDCKYILMAESFHLSYSKSFLNYLRKKYKDSKLCFVFSNPVGSYNLEKVELFKSYYDAIITFSKDDAAKYNFLYCDVLPYRLPNPDHTIKEENDVFFIGANKGRIGTILTIYQRLTDLGLKCDFYIVGVPEEAQVSGDGIVYNHRISYEEVLRHVQKSRCVLEILQEGCNYVSIKTCEAVHYHKKILTTNQYADESRVYNEQYVRIIHDVNDIDKDFVTAKIEDRIFEDSNLVETFDPLISFLESSLK